MKYKILVVDDDKELVKMLCSYFNMKQYETITATDGMEVLNKIKMKPDIIWTIVNKKDTIFKYIFWERLDYLPIPECCFHFIWCQIA